MNTVFCKFCGSNTERIFENGLECKFCNTVQVHIMPSDQVLHDYYLNFNNSYTGGGPAQNQIKYARSYLKLVRSFKNKIHRLLDVGCSNSPFPNIVVDLKIEVSILDVVRPINLDERVNFFQGLLDSDFCIPVNQKFDVITAWAVIEHVRDVDFSISNTSKSLNIDGYFFLTTPEIGTFMSNYNMGRTPWFFTPEHLHILSPNCLAKIAEKYGLKLVSNGHFEITYIRYFVRYYVIGFAETLLGLCMKYFSEKLFEKIKMRRLSSFKGIQYMVFKKFS